MALSNEHKEALDLMTIHGMTIPDVSAHLGVPESLIHELWCLAVGAYIELLDGSSPLTEAFKRAEAYEPEVQT
ncbi:hypothetical protein L2735_14085 [Shewanella olleyana]|uniref:hypothetical protein n=1 Tax=Shewanella olleyana TaxID=135626 RepID=UPI00200EE21F|nr:hypothetical protein [Shewanella olleyana]MCL1067920.1 hypothetical protein [Shewanella olleyana]